MPMTCSALPGTSCSSPVGMHHAVIEFDAAGTPIGSTRIYASARDWARFGELYLNDGVVGDKRILPPGWVAYSTRQHAGQRLRRRVLDQRQRQRTMRDGAFATACPADTFYASGLNGQRIVVVPSQHLVIARLGSTIDPPNYDMARIGAPGQRRDRGDWQSPRSLRISTPSCHEPGLRFK